MGDILAIDDDKLVRKLLQEFLEHDGHRVRTAKNGVEAMVMVDDQQPDLIITDIYMPEQNGFETIMEIERKYRGEIKVIAISGDTISREGGHSECLEIAKCLGSAIAIEKPFTKSQILTAVREALGG